MREIFKKGKTNNMNKIYIKDVSKSVGKEVYLEGWLYNKRGSGKLYFLQIRDGSGKIQAIVSQSDVSEDVFKVAENLSQESSIKITGKISQHPKKEDVFEMQVTNLELVHETKDEYPISNKEHGISFLLDNRHLWLRSSKQIAIQRVRNTIINSIFSYFNELGYIKIDSPILTPNACEGTTELFEIEYFDLGEAYLSQSGQLYLEAAIFAHGKCFDFGPVFRAEKSKTRRHLTEFWMMDAEAAFVKHEENMQIQEGMILRIIKDVLEKNRKDLIDLERDIEKLEKIKGPFIRKTHAEAVKELREMGSDIEENHDLGADDETMLTEKYDLPIFVEKYPAEVKAFYMKRDPENDNLALCADLLAPEGYGEIIGGSEREDDYETLKQRILEHDLPLKEFEWYLDLRKYGSVPHSGFGLGLERIVTWLCGIHHVRETIPFPRTIKRITP